MHKIIGIILLLGAFGYSALGLFMGQTANQFFIVSSVFLFTAGILVFFVGGKVENAL